MYVRLKAETNRNPLPADGKTPPGVLITDISFLT